LLVRVQQEESSAEAGLRTAVASHGAAVRRQATCADVVARAQAALAEAQRQQQPGTVAPVVAHRLVEAARFVEHRRVQVAVARSEQDRSAAEVAEQMRSLAAARGTFASAQGRRQAIEKRIEAALDAERRAAESRAEDEAADIASARGGPGNGPMDSRRR
jgi:hypothetical protein